MALQTGLLQSTQPFEILPLAPAGYEGASQAKEIIITLVHVIHPSAVIVTAGVLLWHVPGLVQKSD